MSADEPILYTVKIVTTCAACAMALVGHAPRLRTIRAAFVSQLQEDTDAPPLTIHANSAWIQAHDGSPLACPVHGATLDLSREPPP